MLRFFGYFKEAVTERREENYRIRRCIICYYLEDGSLHIDEPKEDNSGLPQGVFLRRHRVPKTDGSFVGPSDFVVGGELEVYARTFFILACDPFTRSFLENSGFTVGPDQEYPASTPHHSFRREFQRKVAAPSDANTHFWAGPNKKSLELDKKVLRFYAVWDDRGALLQAQDFPLVGGQQGGAVRAVGFLPVRDTCVVLPVPLNTTYATSLAFLYTENFTLCRIRFRESAAISLIVVCQGRKLCD